MDFPNPSNVGEMKQLLETILSTTNNAERKAAETAVVRSLRNGESVGYCVDLIQDTDNSQYGIRQLAAILLRKKIFSLWRDIEVEHQEQLKQILIGLLATEPVKVVRLAVMRVVAALAKAEISAAGNNWPELHTAICQAAESEDPAHRELSMILTYSVCEVIGDQPDFIQGVGQCIWECLTDVNVEVRFAALKAVQVVIPFLGHRSANQTSMLEGVIPRVLQVIEEHLCNEESVTLVLRTLDLIEQLVEALSVKRHSDDIVKIVQFLGQVMEEKNTHMRIREHAAEVCGMIVEAKKKLIVKRGLVDPMINVCLGLMAEDNTITFDRDFNESDDEMDDEELELIDVRPPTMFGGLLLSQMAKELPAKQMIPQFMSYVQRASINRNTSPLEKKGVIIGLAAVCEGGSGTLRRQVPSILNLCKTYMEDPEPVVQESAIYSLQFFIDNLQPEILTHHRTLMPMLTSQLGSEHDSVRNRAAATLDSLCENLAEDLEDYIPDLLPALVDCINVSSIPTQTSVCGAIAAIAQTKCPAIIDKAEDIFNLLQEPMKLTSSDSIKLRARASEAVGILAVGCGRERFRPFFDFFHGAVMEGFKSDRPELKEQCFGYYANMCEMLQRDFAELLPEVMPALIISINEDNAVMSNKDPLAQDITIGDDLESDTEDDDDEGEIHMRVRTADVEEKCAAVYALGIFAAVLRDLFEPYVRQCEELLETFASHYHTVVRQNAIKTMAEMVVSRVPPGELQVKIGIPESDELPSDVRDVVQHYMVSVLLPNFTGDTDEAVITACGESIDVLLKAYGAQAVHEHVDDICNVVVTMLRGQHPCQMSEGMDGDDEGGIAYAHNEALDKVVDTLEKLAGVYGPDFNDHFSEIGPDLFPYLEEDREGEDYALATGCLANVLLALGPCTANFFDTCFEIAMRLIEDCDESAARSNCCLLLRALAENAGHKFDGETCHQALGALWQVAACEDEIPAAVDNAISAACSFIRCIPHLTPVETMLANVLRNIPMRIDREENENCISTVAYLMEHQQSLCDDNLKAVVECCGKVMSTPTVTRKLKDGLGEAMTGYFGSRREQYAAVYKELPNRLRNALSNAGFSA